MSKKHTGIGLLALGALGVVFGDLGTSPLYALSVLFGGGQHSLPVNPANVYGVLSLIIWTVIIVVTIKYVAVIMRVDNGGEGGIMALVALVRDSKIASKYKWWLVMAGIVGISLFYGDSVITPAISVLSAVEGLRLAAPSLGAFVVPITAAIIVLLFGLQRFGTAVIGKLFGPVMLTWFVVIGIAGLVQVWLHPSALIAFSPLTAISFFINNFGVAFMAMTAVVLAVTGAEALYADMGHFGRKPIARAWFLVVLPCLLLCYLGQAAVLVNNPSATSSPFYHLFPSFLFVPAVILATLATLIASQSVISGAFSLTRQAVSLGFLPNMEVRHTSDRETGQIYLPFVNSILFVVVIGLVLAFGSSAALAGAYGVAISGALLIDSILFIGVIVACGMNRWLIVLSAAIFLPIEILLVSANMTKVVVGGWFPLVIATIMIAIIVTWQRGETKITLARQKQEGLLVDYVSKLDKRKFVRVPGQAVYIGHHAGYTPLAFRASVEQLRELHKQALVVVVKIANTAHILPEKRTRFDSLKSDKDGIAYLEITYGYHDTPNIPRTLSMLSGADKEFKFKSDSTHYFVSLTRAVAFKSRFLLGWQKILYIFMARNSHSASDHYHLPIDKTIDIESLIEL